MDTHLSHSRKLDKHVRTFLGRQMRLYYGILASDTPPRFGEILRKLDDPSFAESGFTERFEDGQRPWKPDSQQ
jgi:hypothetical protein